RQTRSAGCLRNRTGLYGGRDPRPHRNQPTECDCKKKRRVTVIRNNVMRNAWRWAYPESICIKCYSANRTVPKSEPRAVGKGPVQMKTVSVTWNCVARHRSQQKIDPDLTAEICNFKRLQSYRRA